MHLFTMLSFIVVGLLFIGLSIPLILRRIPPNWMYGFRVAKTLENPEIWYNANEYAGKRLALAGVVITLASIILAFVRLPDVGNGGPEFTYAITMVLIMTVSVLISLISSLRYLKTL